MAGAFFLTNMRYSIQFTGGMEVVVERITDAQALTTQLETALQEQ